MKLISTVYVCGWNLLYDRILWCLLPCILLLSAFHPVWADSIVDSPHNLSSTGPGSVRALVETGICIFCHTPHHGSAEGPLWNRFASAATYTPYSSTTAKATVGQPTGSSKLCLSCHDGTVALGMVQNPGASIPFSGGVVFMPTGAAHLGTDLSDDHPISFTYDQALVNANSQLKDPATLPDEVKLDPSGQLQCTSCHDPHDNEFGQFLVMNNFGSALCITCHNQNHWDGSSHRTSTAIWNGNSTDPWPLPCPSSPRVYPSACRYIPSGHQRRYRRSIRFPPAVLLHR